jgi:hypothetical protein
VRPILSDRCFRCHGPDSKKRKARLRLDTEDGVHKDLDELLRRITTDDEDDRMPPSDIGPRLTAAQVATVRRWIAGGAKWQPHWAFAPVRRPPAPAAQSPWVRNDVDRFVLARLQAAGLTPSPEADRVTLIRRVSLDLTGLPPTPTRCAPSSPTPPDAYERVVDRLLASPHHGERWGRRWLDLARYADSNGYSIDAPRSIWKYRDWVVDALDRDMPFDQFVVEQIAGDLLPGATIDRRSRPASTATPCTTRRAASTSSSSASTPWPIGSHDGQRPAGLTLGCARCHDHKFDPLTQKEFFQCSRSSTARDEPVLELGTPDEVERGHAVRAQISWVEGELVKFERQWVSDLPEARRKEIPTEVSTILALGPDQRDDRQWRTLGEYLRKQNAGFRERLDTVDSLRRRMPKYASTLVMKERERPRETHVHIGGDFTRPGDKVDPGCPACCTV